MTYFAADKRAEYRGALSRLNKALDLTKGALLHGAPLPANLVTFLEALTDTKDIPRQHEALVSMIHTTEKEYHGKLKDAARDDFLAFYEYLNPDEPPAPHHVFMGDRLMDMEKRYLMRLLLSLPPGHAKSTYASQYFPAWYLGRNPNHKYIQAGHSQDFCENQFGKKVRGIVEKERYRDVFPGIGLSQESKAAGAWALANHSGAYLTKGVGQGISGYRGNIGAVDDPFAKREDAESATIRTKVYDWFMADFTTRLLPNSPLFVVATRWHPDDLCGRLEEQSKAGKGMPYEVINLPALAEDEDDPMGRETGAPLWPDFYTTEHLLNLRDSLPSRDWNSLYMGKPVDEEGGIVKKSWFQRYDVPICDEIAPNGLIIKKNVKRTTISVDCANKDTKRSDWSVVTVWKETLDHQHHLIDVVRRRVQFNDLVLMIENTAKRHKADAILVEDKGAGTQYIQTRRGLAPAPVIAVNVGIQSKQFRFDGVSPMIQGGRVYIPTKIGWLADFEAELLAFPNGKHDDQVDSVSQYLAWARGSSAKRGTRKMTGQN